MSAAAALRTPPGLPPHLRGALPGESGSRGTGSLTLHARLPQPREIQESGARLPPPESGGTKSGPRRREAPGAVLVPSRRWQRPHCSLSLGTRSRRRHSFFLFSPLSLANLTSGHLCCHSCCRCCSQGCPGWCDQRHSGVEGKEGRGPSRGSSAVSNVQDFLPAPAQPEPLQLWLLC